MSNAKKYKKKIKEEIFFFSKNIFQRMDTTDCMIFLANY